MSSSYTYKYPRPMVTVDLVVFAMSTSGLRSLFIRRKNDPFAGRWAIPGGYLEMDEPIEAAALRELKEETGLDRLAIVEEIGVFGEPGRDPRGRTISIAHAGAVKGPPRQVEGGDDAAGAAWLDPATVSGLAFDHDAILSRAIEWLSRSSRDDRFLLALLPEQFRAADLNALLQAVQGRENEGAKWIARGLRSGVIERMPGLARSYREVRDRQ